ncbi:MAG: 16S rRNA (adenine(1518)-N(6)/adenine(1519)-N(6))-dimethyltransferase RsmA [Pseudomonadota bacterium]
MTKEIADRALTNARANKSLGQHFLFDPNILARAAGAAGPVDGRTVIEVGPGPGGLTAALLKAGAKRVIAIEADPRFAEALADWPEAGDRLHVTQADARKTDWRALIKDAGGDEPAMIIANLPYNVGTPLLVDWLKAGDWRGEMALMFQLEVAERICAAPGDKHYGRLAVLAQAVTRPHIAFTLPPGAFKPPPKVASAVVTLQPLSHAERYHDLSKIERVAAAAFGQRRKMLRASLKSLVAGGHISAEALLESVGIDPTRRAETLSQEEFRALADAWTAKSA